MTSGPLRKRRSSWRGCTDEPVSFAFCRYHRIRLSVRAFTAMPERNASIAAVLDEIADLLDIQGANPFRVRAYRNAARSIGDLGTEVDVLMEQGTPITDIAGIGEDLAKKIVEILHTGTCDVLKQLHAELSPAITQLLEDSGARARVA